MPSHIRHKSDKKCVALGVKGNFCENIEEEKNIETRSPRTGSTEKNIK
jgi:hypothetical protein